MASNAGEQVMFAGSTMTDMLRRTLGESFSGDLREMSAL
jgi:hypothetical protein